MGFFNFSHHQGLTVFAVIITGLLILDVHLRLNPLPTLADASIPLEEIYTAPDDEELEAFTRGNPQKKRIVPSMTFQPEEIDYTEVTEIENNAKLTDAELAYILEDASFRTKSKSELEKCHRVENIFFLKSSKTGSTTMMSIMQRIGLSYDMNFLMGENHGGMAVNNRPFNLEKDCWIGKNDQSIKFSMSTNHLHYNKSAVDAVMKHPFVRLGIMREPESQFISSFNFYHNLMPRFTRLLNPNGQYHRYEKVKGMKAQSRPTKNDIELEMSNFLSKPWKVLQNNFPTNAFAWMSTIRPQLLFYGKSPKGVESFDENLERKDVIEWIKLLVQDFDLMMMLDEFDKSLALIAIEFCLPVEDLLYIAVNQRKEHSEKATIGEQSLIKLKELNWPDFLLYQTFSTIFKKKIDHYTNLFGYDYVGKVAEEIKRKSQEISADCIDERMHTTSSLIDRVFIKQHMQMNSTCLKLQFQGTRATKLFMVKQIDELYNKKYPFCGNKVAYGEHLASFNSWKHQYLNHFSRLKGS